MVGKANRAREGTGRLSRRSRYAYHLIHGHRAVRERHGTKNNTNDVVHGRLVPRLVLVSHPLHLRRHACPRALTPCLLLRLLLLAPACALGREPSPCPAALLPLRGSLLLRGRCCRRLSPGGRIIGRKLPAPLVLELLLATREAGPRF